MSSSSLGILSQLQQNSSTASSSAGGTLSSPGIGSGLNVNGIVSSLMSVESQPLNLLNQQEASYKTKLSAYGSLTAALSSLQSAAAALEQPSVFDGQTASVSNSQVLSASADSSAAPGTYSVSVSSLAQAQSIASAGQASETSQLGTGIATTLSISFGTTSGTSFSPNPSSPAVSIPLPSGSQSLQQIAAAVNSAGAGVSASIVNDGSSNPYRLVLTSKSGAAESMTISASGDPALASLLDYSPSSASNMTQTQAAQDASLSINGIAISSPSDVVSGAVQGMSLTLSNVGNSSITVAPDSSAAQKAISSFVSSYNSAISAINSATAYDSTTKTAGPLLGDYAAASIRNQLSSVASSAFGGNSLSSVGISMQKDGTLSIDQTKLTSALTPATTGTPSVAQNLFATNGSQTALASAFDSGISSIIGSSGQIASAENGINSEISGIGSQITSMNAYLKQVQQNYLNQFTALDVLMGQMQQTSSYLTQQLANLPKVN